jgi:hypothetical protein
MTRFSGTRDMMNPTLRDTPTWTAALVIETHVSVSRSLGHSE